MPSGASTGEHEAVELRDGGDRYGGKGVRQAVGYVNGEIADELRGRDALDQRLDRHGPASSSTAPTTRPGSAPTPSSGTSLAVAKAAADELELPLYRYVGGANAHVLPVPMMNVVNGGVHADNSIDLQEFMVMPIGAPELRRGDAVGDRDVPRAEAAAPRPGPVDGRRRRGRLRSEPGDATRTPSRILVEAIEAAGFRPGEDIAIALDPATSELYRDGRYHLAGEGKVLDAATRWSSTGGGSSRRTRSCRSRTAWPRTTGRAGPR